MVHPYLRRRQDKEQVDLSLAVIPSMARRTSWSACWARRWACRCSRSRRCASPSRRRSSRPSEANACAAPWRPSATSAPSICSSRRWSRAWSAAATTRDFAARCFQQIEGFGDYGFPESHAASFALLVYVSSWLKCHHPAAFAAALLNSQPMGFYAPAQIVRDAREHGVEVRAPRRQRQRLGQHAGGAGRWRSSRCGSDLRQIDGFREDWAQRLVAHAARLLSDGRGPAAPRAGCPRPRLSRLAEADAMRSMGLDRREAAWAVRRLPDDIALPLFEAAGATSLPRSRWWNSPPCRCPSMSWPTTRRSACR